MISRRFFLGTAATTVLAARWRPAFAQTPVQVAGIHTVPVENPWNSRLHAALQSADAAGTIEYVFSESVANTDYARAMRQYAEQGARLIVGESYGVEREARQVAADYPDTAFLMGSSGGPEGDNFGVFGTWNHEAGFLSGIAAAGMSQTGKFGSVGGYPIPEVNRLINAFRMGVREVRPDAEFLVGFIGAWFDPPKAKESALAQIDAGADVLFGERIGTLDAAAERGVYGIGSLTDWIPQYPESAIASALWIFDPVLAEALRRIGAGEPVGIDYREFSFMPAGGNDIVLNDALVPAEVRDRVMARREDIRNGTFVVPIDDSEPT